MTHAPTTWDHDPHGPDGKLDFGKLAESIAHGTKQLADGKEAVIDAYQVAPDGAMPPPPTDGSYYTIYHHAPATAPHPGVKPALAAAKAHMSKHGMVPKLQPA